MSRVLGFRRLFLILLVIVMCYNLKWSRDLLFWRPLALERGKRWRNIRHLYLMGRWTTFVDKHEEGLKKKKKIPLEINGHERERENLFLGIVDQNYG